MSATGLPNMRLYDNTKTTCLHNSLWSERQIFSPSDSNRKWNLDLKLDLKISQ